MVRSSISSSINSAVFVGYKMRGMKGVMATVFGTVIPSFVVILVIAMFFSNIRDNEAVTRVFKGLRPAVVALIVVSYVQMLQKKKFLWHFTLISILAAMSVFLLKISPIIVILIAAIGGIMCNKK